MINTHHQANENIPINARIPIMLAYTIKYRIDPIAGADPPSYTIPTILYATRCNIGAIAALIPIDINQPKHSNGLGNTH